MLEIDWWRPRFVILKSPANKQLFIKLKVRTVRAVHDGCMLSTRDVNALLATFAALNVPW